MIDRLLSRIKGEQYELDPRIPTSYLLGYFGKKILFLLYGMIRLHTFKRVFIHPSSKILCSGKLKTKGNLNIDAGCYIDALSEIGFICGRNVNLGRNTTVMLSGSLHKIGKGAILGDNIALGTHGFYGSGMGMLQIGSDVIFGNYVSIHPENHNYHDTKIPIRHQGVSSLGGVKIGDNCWIGAKATLLDGTVIGNGCIVAAGAVVKGEFPDNVIIGGVPAKIIKYRDGISAKRDS